MEVLLGGGGEEIGGETVSQRFNYSCPGEVKRPIVPASSSSDQGSSLSVGTGWSCCLTTASERPETLHSPSLPLHTQRERDKYTKVIQDTAKGKGNVIISYQKSTDES